MLNPVIYLISKLISLYIFILIAQIVVSWLISFNVLNAHQPFVFRLNYALHRLTEPALKPIRNVLPNLGGIDISPILLIIGLHFIDYTLLWMSL